MRHEVIPKTLFVPFSDKLTLWRPFALIPVSNGDRDAIPNQNSALLYKYFGSLFGGLRFALRGYHRNGVMSCCRQLFGRASFVRFARCGGLKEETFVILYTYNSIIYIHSIYIHTTQFNYIQRTSYMYTSPDFVKGPPASPSSELSLSPSPEPSASPSLAPSASPSELSTPLPPRRGSKTSTEIRLDQHRRRR